jgi:hypothetical protein
MLSRCLLASLLLLGLAGCSREPETALRPQAVTNGQLDSGHPSVGALYTTAGYACSATLVGARSVLTAAHCIEPQTTYLFAIEGGPYLVSSAVPHPSYNPATDLFDLGIMRLSGTPPVTPSTLSPDAPWVGMSIVIVGLGCADSSSCTYGTKRMAQNVVKTVSPGEFLFSDGNGKGGHCSGDSGGPTFTSWGGREVLVGVHSHGPIVCGTDSWDARVDGELAWIKQQTEGDVSIGPHVAPPPRPDSGGDRGDGGDRGEVGPADAARPDARAPTSSSGCALAGAPAGLPLPLLLLLTLLRARARRPARAARGG